MIARAGALRWTAVALGFLFLYAPIAVLVVYSFNVSRLVTVWGGFSTRWYGALLQDAALLDSLRVSLSVAALSSTIATVVGCAAAIALARQDRFHGRYLLEGLIYAPLALPDVITGISLLLLFVALGLPRGFWAIVLAHATVGICFVAIVVRARLRELDPLLAEAARDLGATPLRVLLSITLPLTAPAIVSGYLLAFTLSLDDVVIASFTSGPGATTLPIRILSQIRLGVSPEINAVSSVIVAVTLILAIGVVAVNMRMATSRSGR